jgi:hypothetical protein
VAGAFSKDLPAKGPAAGKPALRMISTLSRAGYENTVLLLYYHGFLFLINRPAGAGPDVKQALKIPGCY